MLEGKQLVALVPDVKQPSSKEEDDEEMPDSDDLSQGLSRLVP